MRTPLHAPRAGKRSIAAAALGTLALIGSLLVATPAQALSDTGTGGVFTPSTGRILDTAKGTGGFSTPMEAGKYRTIKVAGLAGLPKDGSVGAVSLNATVGASTGYGTLFARPDANTSRTTMLIYNGVSGEYTSNSATVAVGSDGTIQVMTETSARLILDVQGYYTSNTDGTAAGGFVPVAKRIVDTRSGLGAAKATIAPGKSIDVQVTGTNGVPAGASSAVVNLIALNSTDADGYLTPYATGGSKPANSLHYAPSETTSIQAQVPLSSAGKMTIANASTTANLVVDLQGYFTAAGKSGAVFTPASGRVYDSRATGNKILAKNETRSIQVAGAAGLPVMGSGVSAVVLTLIVAHGGSNGYADVYADGKTNPGITAVNFQTNEIQTNTITVPLGANGKIALRNAAEATNYVIDVQGWYSSPKVPTVSCPSIASGKWVATVPSSPVSCTVTAPARSSSDGTLVVTVDSAPVTFKRSDTATTTSTVLVDNLPGAHTVTATTVDGDSQVSSGSYTFGLGDWATKQIASDPSNGATIALDSELSVYVPDDDIPADAAITYTLRNNSGDTVATSDAVNDSWQIPDGILVDGATYSWQASITGKSGGRSTDSTVIAGPYTFTASSSVANDPAFSEEEDNAAPQYGPGSEVVAADADNARVPLGDGTALTLPDDAVLTETADLYHVVYANGFVTDVSKAPATIAGAQSRAASQYYPKISFYFSRSQVEAAYKALQIYGEICGAPGVAWTVGWACSHANRNLQDAITSAHYQKKRIRHDFYRSKVCGSCSRNVYTVVK
ncbi:hypothetical protein HUN58_02025 [Curtobacterium sp. Csp1]|uniref:hypothetical protein n=1 Tax=Curtobacterium sp. Csp1 TaxID=2495429 RepID=UPI0015993470|nr:hypothetical protein [Curtobacterium sp. Csp1]QKS18840.1 hypothetical protein HUN58_02025 [Curtobacterium sp. Csp1]